MKISISHTRHSVCVFFFSKSRSETNEVNWLILKCFTLVSLSLSFVLVFFCMFFVQFLWFHFGDAALVVTGFTPRACGFLSILNAVGMTPFAAVLIDSRRLTKPL